MPGLEATFQRALDYAAGALLLCAVAAHAIREWLRRRSADMKKPRYVLEFYRDAQRQYRWRLKHRNGNLVACCGEGYRTKLACRTACWNLFKKVGAGDVEARDLCRL